ncbi:MAG: hypothetical protein ACJ72H_25865 [Candidatus Sulfotelmatobacter sp.]
MVGPFEEFGVVDIRQCLLGIRVFLELSHFRGLILGEVPLGIDWGLSAFWAMPASVRRLHL